MKTNGKIYQAEWKAFSFHKTRWIPCLCFFLLLILMLFAINQVMFTKRLINTEELRFYYEKELESKTVYLAMCLGEIPPDRPVDTQPEIIKEMQQRITQLKFYLENNTSEHDYLRGNYELFMKNKSPNTYQGAALYDYGTICVFALIFFGIVLGVAAVRDLTSNKGGRLRVLSGMPRKKIWTGKMLFSLTLAGIFCALLLSIGLLYCRQNPSLQYFSGLSLKFISSHAVYVIKIAIGCVGFLVCYFSIYLFGFLRKRF